MFELAHSKPYEQQNIVLLWGYDTKSPHVTFMTPQTNVCHYFESYCVAVKKAAIETKICLHCKNEFVISTVKIVL